MSPRTDKKRLVLSKRELGDATHDEVARIRHVVDVVPSAEIAADYGPIVQIAVEADEEPMLRSMIEQNPRWDVSEDDAGQMAEEKGTAMTIRKNVWRLPANDQTLHYYALAVKKMKSLPATDPTSWAHQAGIHGVPGMSNDPQGFLAACQHGTAFFVSWHRMYLRQFERIVRKYVVAAGGPADWALPYWNYSYGPEKGRRLLPEAFRNPTLPDHTANPLYVANRNDPVNQGAEFFDDEDIRVDHALFAKKTTTAAGFFGMKPRSHFAGTTHVGGRLETTVHNNVHGAIGGLMGNPDVAARDPIFWLHHANIDRLWSVWLARSPANTNPTTQIWLTGVKFKFHDENGAVVTMTSKDVIGALDYTYDDVADPFPGQGVGHVAAAGDLVEEDVSELVGATETPIVLGHGVEHVELPTPVAPGATAAGTIASVAGVVAIDKLVPVAMLHLENVKSNAHSPTYDVYLNVPDGADPKAHKELFVQRMTLFGVAQASDAANPHGGSGQTVTFDITDLYRKLYATTGFDKSKLRVSFVPVRPEHGATVQVGRISLYFG